MKFFVAFFALATVASARNIVFSGNGNGGYGNGAALAAPYHRQSLTLTPVQATAARVVAVQPVQQQQVQLVAVAQPQVQTVQLVQAQPVQYQAASSGPITAAVQSRYSLEVVDVPTRGAVAPTQTIVIGPSVQPLDFEFQSQSSPISVRQTHIPGTPNPTQTSSHRDEPDILRQEIVKPIIHEVTEAIQPLRKITQEVRPVQEEINQIITRGQQVQRLQAVQPVQAQAQVATVAVQAQPVQTIAVQAAPVQTVAVQAAPAIQTANVELVGNAEQSAQIIGIINADQLSSLGSVSGLSGSSLQLIKKKK